MSTTEDASELSERAAPVVHNHYTQSKNGNGNGQASRLNTILIACAIGILAFMGTQVWTMNTRLASVEVVLNLLVARSGIASPPQ